MPEIGRMSNQTPNTNTNNRPTQNVGMLHSAREPTTVEESMREPRLDADQTPSPTPKPTTRIVAAPKSRTAGSISKKS